MCDVPIVEVQPPRAKQLRREVELSRPVVDRRPAEEAARPLIHFCGDLFGNRKKHGISMDGQPQVPLIVERHRRDLAERVFAVEHPPVGAREQRVGDVSDALLDRRAGPGRRARALNPLAAEVRWDLAPGEGAVPGILDGDAGPRDRGALVQEGYALFVACACCPPLDASCHHGFAISVESRQLFEGVGGVRGVDVLIGMRQVASDLECSWCHRAFNVPHGV